MNLHAIHMLQFTMLSEAYNIQIFRFHEVIILQYLPNIKI